MIPGMDGAIGIDSPRGGGRSIVLIEMIPQAAVEDNIILEINAEN